MWVVEPNILAIFVYSLCSTIHPITICTSDANRPEKKDQVLKKPMYTAWLSFL